MGESAGGDFRIHEKLSFLKKRKMFEIRQSLNFINSKIIAKFVSKKPKTHFLTKKKTHFKSFFQIFAIFIRIHNTCVIPSTRIKTKLERSGKKLVTQAQRNIELHYHKQEG